MRAVLVAAAACALAIAGCGGEMREDAAAPPAPASTETAEAPTDPDRPPAPPIEGESLDGEAVSLADFRGRPVLVNVWSSW